MRRFGVGVVALVLVLMVCGCNSWEKTTFQTLSASQALINQANADYASGVIPSNNCAYALINQATAADTLAVNAFEIYEQEKQASAAATVLADQQAVVVELLTNLAPLASDIALLKSNPIAACAGVKL